MYSIKQDFLDLCRALIWYSKRKIASAAARFEDFKNFSVEILMVRRGALQKQVWHGAIVGLASVGILTSGIFGGRTLVSATFPGVGGPDPRFATSFEPFPNGPILDASSFGMSIHTNISEKPRSEIIEYKVESGDTLSGVAKKFGISSDTIKWANNLDSIHTIKPGEVLKILPVTGVAHSVKSGDTLESVAKKYQAEPQAIMDFPFNDVPDDFSLKVGQVLIVPDGVKEDTPVRRRSQPQYLAQGPSSPVFKAEGGAKFVWPTNGGLSQGFAWYHPGIDIPNKSAPPIAASDGGTVMVAGWPDGQGFGNRVVIDHGNGYRTLYAHLSNIYVSIGQTVSRGQVIGQMGSTGRSTGTHLHFEIHYRGIPINPLLILR
ncbi:M23 family metallopeptidase [Candidatus Daviesbacteria bacterium]|nr:M23 family metallopeptidase [Candidatus Daviesbacteria bacterium]